MQNPVSPLEKNATFCFTCSPHVPCFNACCRDLNQVLTPFDVLCLKQHLEMTSTDFLATYTQRSTGPGTGLPVVSLRFGDKHDLSCPFVSPDGCSVYPARPGSCRTYPLARGVYRDRKTGKRVERWAVIREPHCRGFENGRAQTAEQWVNDQQIAVHNRMNDRMLALIQRKNQLRPGILAPSESNLVYTALYDLDAFRKKVGETMAKTDDVNLLEYAINWVRQEICKQTPV